MAFCADLSLFHEGMISGRKGSTSDFSDAGQAGQSHGEPVKIPLYLGHHQCQSLVLSPLDGDKALMN